MKTNVIILFFALIFINFSCKDYLDIKPDKKLVVLSTTAEAQALLNNILFNTAYPASGEIASDHYYVKDTDWLSVRALSERNAYIWAKDVFNESPRNDWSLTYEKVYNANLVIDAIKEGKIEGSLQDRNHVLGQALFFRAYSFYQVLQLFAKPWDSKLSASDPGIPLRLSSDFNRPSKRETVARSYQQIIEDLLTASELLESNTPTNVRPAKQAAYALLSRIYLLTEDYEKAVEYSDKTLKMGDNLMDYSTINPNQQFSFSQNNVEVIWLSIMNLPQILNSPILKVDPAFIRSYTENDLRPQLFYTLNTVDSTYAFKGSYFGLNILFNGLSVNEIYFIKAESLARLGKLSDARDVLNRLLSKRYPPDTFQPVVSPDKTELLARILDERGKELVFRGLRWTDLRRLNKEDEFKRVIKRRINAQEYILNPNDNAYVFQIPEEVIQLSGIEQNNR